MALPLVVLVVELDTLSINQHFKEPHYRETLVELTGEAVVLMLVEAVQEVWVVTLQVKETQV